MAGKPPDVSRKRIAADAVFQGSPNHPFAKKRKSWSVHPMIRDISEDYDYELSEWLKLVFTKISPLTIFSCAYTNSRCGFIHDFLKRQMRSLVSLVFDLKKLGYCLSATAFEPSNIVVRENSIKFPKTALVEYKEHLFMGSFNLLVEFIMRNFFKMAPKDAPSSQLPPDFLSFLDLLENPVWKSELLIKNHICLMSMTSMESLVNSMHTIRKQMTSIEFYTYCEALGSITDDTDKWKMRIKGTGDKDVFQTCFDGSDYCDRPPERIRYFRNCDQHLLKLARMGHRSSQPPFFTIEQVPVILFARFGDMITRAYEALGFFGLLPLLEPERFFQHDTQELMLI